jgi:hypothetical protein
MISLRTEKRGILFNPEIMKEEGGKHYLNCDFLIKHRQLSIMQRYL